VATRGQRHHPGPPVHRWFTPPGHSGVASRLRLRSGSFAGHRLLLGAGPPTHTSVGHRALPRLELPRARLTPRSASGRLSHQAYSSPTLAGPVRRSQSLQTSSCRGLTAEARDATRPPQVTWTALSDHPRPNHLPPVPGLCCRARFLVVASRGPRLRMLRATSPHGAGLARVHCTFGAGPSPSPPSNPALRRRPGSRLLNENGQTLRKDFRLLVAAPS
jgi:hypothetical protein